MLKINQTFTKLFLLVAIAFLLFFTAAYFSIRLIIVQAEDIQIYNQIWIILSVLLLFILSLLLFSMKSMSYKFSQDVTELHDYLEEVSGKNYDAVVKIRYIQEFLAISLRLKNIVKRLNNKDSKKK